MTDHLNDSDRIKNYLRFVFSAFFGIAAVLLIASWVRGYRVSEILRIPITDSYGAFGTNFNGQILVGCLDTIPRKWSVDGWSFDQIAPNGARNLFGRFGIQKRVVFFPSWFLVLLVGAFAAAPWLPWWSNRFTLRTLLIAITLVALVLGIVVWLSR
jgi:hypothetical protein